MDVEKEVHVVNMKGALGKKDEREQRSGTETGPDDAGVRVYPEEDRGETTVPESSNVGQKTEFARRPLHAENDDPTGQGLHVDPNSNVATRPITIDEAQQRKHAESHPSPRSPREFESHEHDKGKGKGDKHDHSEKGLGDKIKAGWNKLIGREDKEEERHDEEGGFQEDAVSQGQEFQGEPVEKGTETASYTELLGMETGSTTVTGSTPHSKITATVSEAGTKKTISVTEHVQKKGLFDFINRDKE